MKSLFEYSSFSLKNLTMTGDRDEYEKVHNLLRFLPSLEVLELRCWFYYSRPPTGELLDLLCESSSESPSFLPRLRNLNLGFSFPFSLECIPRIFASSHRQSLRLKIDYKRDISGAHMTNERADQLLELVDQGFDLTVIQGSNVDILRERRVNRGDFQTPPSPSPLPPV